MTPKPLPHNIDPVTLGGFWLTTARVLWVVLALAAIGPVLLNIPAYFSQVVDYSAAGVDGAFRYWTVDALRSAVETLGISSTSLALFVILGTLLSFALFAVVGLIIFFRRSDQLIGLLTSFLFVVLGHSFGPGIGSNLAGIPPVLAEIRNQVFGFIWALFFIFFTLFPDGRFVPGWTRWLVPFWILIALSSILNSLGIIGQPAGLVSLLFPILAVLSLGSQVYRYRSAAGALERQQIRWFAAAGIVFGLYWIPQFPFINLPGIFFPALNQLGPEKLLFDLIDQGVAVVVSAFLPISIAIALLRYHLWDLDFIIRRTLLYAVLSGLLGLIYFGSVLLLRQLMGGLAGVSSAAIVISTLLIAALFSPLRRRAQGFIDQRFYRNKYNAEQAMQEFSTTSRREVGLDQLQGQLVAVITETVQPESVSVWIRPAGLGAAGLVASPADVKGRGDER